MIALILITQQVDIDIIDICVTVMLLIILGNINSSNISGSMIIMGILLINRIMYTNIRIMVIKIMIIIDICICIVYVYICIYVYVLLLVLLILVYIINIALYYLIYGIHI